MISTLISLALSVGLPAIITGILGKWTTWLTPLTTFAPFIGVVVKLCTGLIDIILHVVRWLVEKILTGLDHIVKSVPATATLLLCMWLSYGYGTGFGGWVPSWPDVAVTKPAPAPTSTVRREDIRTPGDWIRETLGVE